jgi:hypothetical protein
MPTKDPEAIKAKRAKENAKRKQDLAEAQTIKANTPHLLTPSHNKILANYEDRLAKNREAKRAGKAALLRDDSSETVSPGVRKNVEKNNPKLVQEIQTLKETPKLAGSKIQNVANPLEAYRPEKKTDSINNDTTHLTLMNDLAMHLSDKLRDAQEKGSLMSHNTAAADIGLSRAWDHHQAAYDSHSGGSVDGAKYHMKETADNLISVVENLRNKPGINIKPGIHHIINDTANRYINSKTPGVGAMPEEDFKAPKIEKISSAPVVKEKVKEESFRELKTKLDETGDEPRLTKAISRGGYERIPRVNVKQVSKTRIPQEEMPDIDDTPPDLSFGPSLGKQFREQGGYKTGKEHMNSAVIGMMEGRG